MGKYKFLLKSHISVLVPKKFKNTQTLNLKQNIFFLWRKKIIKKNYFECFTQKYAKMHCRYATWGNDKTLREMCIMIVFERLR